MSHEKILVVEDEEEIRELVAYTLVKQGYRAIPVESGEQALRSVRSESPNLIVLDLMLPGMDGLEVCRTLKRNPETDGIPLVMLTAKGEESDIVTGLELGADDYLTKPFSPRVLIKKSFGSMT
jgi:two-component system phosphate regulon response regulator PhoB